MKFYAAVVRWIARVLTLLLISGSVWLEWGTPEVAWAQGRATQPDTARFVESSAPVMVSLLDSADELGSLIQPTTRSLKNDSPDVELTHLPASLLASVGLNYTTDIQPWVADEITFALNQLTKDDPGNGDGRKPVEAHRAPSYLIAFTTKGKRSSQDCIEALWQKQVAAGRQLKFEQYNGINLISTQLADSSESIPTAILPESVPTPGALATAVIESRYVLIANATSVLRQVVHNLEFPDRQLANAPAYEQALAQLQGPQRDGLIFVNLAALGSQGHQASSAVAPRYHSLALSLSGLQQDLLVETVLIAASEQESAVATPTLSRSLQTLDYVPIGSPLVAAGPNLNQLWTQLHEDVQGYAGLSGWLDRALSSWGQQWHLDLPQDIFPWVESEYAVAMVPPRSGATLGTPATRTPEWVFIHETDQNGNEQRLQHNLFDRAAGQGIGLIPYQQDPYRQISAWARVSSAPPVSDLASPAQPQLEAEVVGASAQVDHNQIMVTSLAALDSVLAAPQNGLAQQSSFRAAISPLELPNQGYLYFDWPVIRPLLEQQLPMLRQLERAVPILFDQLQTVTVTSYGETSAGQRSQLFFRYDALDEG
jgi:hypothetical protein